MIVGTAGTCLRDFFERTGLPVPYAAGVVDPVDGVLQGEPLSPFLSLLKHARASVRWKVELLHHDVFGDAYLLPQVQPHWHRNTEQQRRGLKGLNSISVHVSKQSVYGDTTQEHMLTRDV